MNNGFSCACCALDPGSTLDHVGENGFHLVLGADHLGRFRVIAAQVDGVKLASGRAHAAAKAAGRLLFDLLFRERAARVAERLARFRAGERRRHLPYRRVEARRRQGNIALVQLGIHAAVAADRQALALVHVAVQGNGGFLADGNGVDHKLRPGGHIAANKDVRLCGLKREAVADVAADGGEVVLFF